MAEEKPPEKTEEQSKAELMSAVDTAVAEATPPDVLEAAKQTTVDPEEAANDPDGAEPEKPPETPAEPDPEKPPEGTPTDKGPPPAPEKKPETPPTETAPPSAPKPPAAEQKPLDPINDPIPDSVKGRTRVRMEALVTSAKTLTGERDAARRDLTDLYAAIEETRAPAKQFADTLDALKGFNSTKAEDRKKAAAYFRGMADAVSSELGEAVPGVDPLDAHPDLKERVADREVSREVAVELALTRNRAAAAARRENEDRSRNDAAAQQQAKIETAKAQLTRMGGELQRGDPQGYAKKNKILEPQIRNIVAHVDPSLWAATYRVLYENLSATLAAVPGGNSTTQPGRAPAGTGTNQPMRPRVAAGGGAVQQPKSALEAINLALGQGGGG